jgi:hypothetical protein
MDVQIAEFRKSMKRYLELAEEQPVVLVRGKQRIKLVPEAESEQLAATAEPEPIVDNSPQAILEKISQTEQQRDEELSYCQDSKESFRIGKEYKKQIDGLWQQWHTLTGK